MPNQWLHTQANMERKAVRRVAHELLVQNSRVAPTAQTTLPENYEWTPFDEAWAGPQLKACHPAAS